MPGKLRICAITDPGLKRSGNEDSFDWWPRNPDDADERGVLLLVCDGMGGAQAGERASHLAVETILKVWKAQPAGNAAEAIRLAFESANTTVHDESRADPTRRG